MSVKKKKISIVLVVVTIAIALLVVISRVGHNPVSNAVKTVLVPFETVVAKISAPIKEFTDFVKNAKNYQKENEQLLIELETVKRQNKSAEEYKKENARLKKLLQLSEELKTCDTVPAKIVSYEPNNWFYSMIINKGTKSGIKVSDVVISDAGVVGQITEVGYNWARISTILDSNQALGIRLSRTGDVGILEGDVHLIKDRCCKISHISKNTTVISGDLLETSGLGGIYPPGLSVGKVMSVTTDNTGELTEAVVQPSVDFDGLHEVLVVTKWEEAMLLVEDDESIAFPESEEISESNEENHEEIITDSQSEEIQEDSTTLEEETDE